MLAALLGIVPHAAADSTKPPAPTVKPGTSPLPAVVSGLKSSINGTVHRAPQNVDPIKILLGSCQDIRAVVQYGVPVVGGQQVESFDLPNWPVERKGVVLATFTKVTTQIVNCGDFEFRVQGVAGPVLKGTPVKLGSQCFANIQFVPFGPATVGVYAKTSSALLLPPRAVTVDNITASQLSFVFPPEGSVNVDMARPANPVPQPIGLTCPEYAVRIVSPGRPDRLETMRQNQYSCSHGFIASSRRCP